MRRIVICGCAFLIGISCAVGCGRTGAETEGAAPAQVEQTGTEAAVGGAEVGETKSKGTESGTKSEKTEAGEKGAGAAGADGEGRNGEKKAGEEVAAGTKDGMAASGSNGTDSGPDIPEALSVEGTLLVDVEGRPVQLKGISTHGLAWYPEYVNAECFRQLREEWGMDVVRLAMYTAESGGYCTGGNQDDLKALVRDGVEYATDCGLYVIIDWHILSDGNPNTYLEEAKKFFQEMAEEYADYENIFYEICNEPNGGTSWSQIKAYAEEIIPVIREQDEDGIILVGTPNWSQYLDQAAADPITGYENIMYTLHFYAATHTDALRDAMVEAVSSGLPVFVSEYGICDASGSGGIDTAQADKWVEAMDEYGISYVAWNLSNKAETSAILKSSCGKTGGFTWEDLSDSGKWLLEMLGSAKEQNTARQGDGKGEAPQDTGIGNETVRRRETPLSLRTWTIIASWMRDAAWETSDSF